MAQIKEKIKAPEKIQEIDNLSDAQFKALVIRTLTEMAEYNCKIKLKVKAMKSEIKENVLETNSDRKESRSLINSFQQFGPKGRNKHSTREE